MEPWYPTPPDTQRNVIAVTGTYTSGRKRAFEVTLIVLPAALLLQERVSFLPLIASPNSAGGVPLRTHVSRREVASDTRNLKGESQWNYWSSGQSKYKGPRKLTDRRWKEIKHTSKRARHAGQVRARALRRVARCLLLCAVARTANFSRITSRLLIKIVARGTSCKY